MIKGKVTLPTASATPNKKVPTTAQRTSPAPDASISVTVQGAFLGGGTYSGSSQCRKTSTHF